MGEGEEEEWAGTGREQQTPGRRFSFLPLGFKTPSRPSPAPRRSAPHSPAKG